MRSATIFSGSSHPKLVERICANLAIEPSNVDLAKFKNGETSVTIRDSVREKDVYVVQSGCGHVNDNFIELLIMISACKTASAKKVTAVMPLFPYSRQPDVPYTKAIVPPGGKTGGKKEETESSSSATSKPRQSGFFKDYNTGYKQWVAQSGTLIASLLTCAGADHIITMDLHDPQFQGFFDIPVDNLYGKPLLQHYISTQIPNYQDAVIVSPDAGGAKRATAIADGLCMDFALIHKERRPTKISGDHIAGKHNATTMLVGDVSGRVAILIDDLLDTSNTITRAAKLLKDQGAVKVYALITHGVFSGDAVEKIKKSEIDKIVTTNSTPQDQHAVELGEKLDVIDISRVFAEAIRRIHNGESVSMLFDHVS